MKIIKNIFLILFILSGIVSYGQTGSVRGFVYEKETGEPVIFCNVMLKGTSYGAATDVNGFFNITKIKPGKYTMEVSFIGSNQRMFQLQSLRIKFSIKKSF